MSETLTLSQRVRAAAATGMDIRLKSRDVKYLFELCEKTEGFHKDSMGNLKAARRDRRWASAYFWAGFVFFTLTWLPDIIWGRS